MFAARDNHGVGELLINEESDEPPKDEQVVAMSERCGGVVVYREVERRLIAFPIELRLPLSAIGNHYLACYSSLFSRLHMPKTVEHAGLRKLRKKYQSHQL